MIWMIWGYPYFRKHPVKDYKLVNVRIWQSLPLISTTSPWFVAWILQDGAPQWCERWMNQLSFCLPQTVVRATSEATELSWGFVIRWNQCTDIFTASCWVLRISQMPLRRIRLKPYEYTFVDWLIYGGMNPTGLFGHRSAEFFCSTPSMLVDQAFAGAGTPHMDRHGRC